MTIQRLNELVTGTRYCGPFTNYAGKPTSLTDAICREHDIAYGRDIGRGGNPYIRFNSADLKMLKRLFKEGIWEDYGTRGYWLSLAGISVKAIFQAWDTSERNSEEDMNRFRSHWTRGGFWNWKNAWRFNRDVRDTIRGRGHHKRPRFSKPDDYIPPYKHPKYDYPDNDNGDEKDYSPPRAKSNKMSLVRTTKYVKPKVRFFKGNPNGAVRATLKRNIQKAYSLGLVGRKKVERILNGISSASAVNQITWYVWNFARGNGNELSVLFDTQIVIGQAVLGTDAEETNTLSAQETFGMIYKITALHEIHNNASHGVMLDFYHCYPKTSTSTTPLADIIAGVDDSAGGDSGWEDEPWVYPSHSMIFKRNWHVTKSQHLELAPGEKTFIKFNIGWSWYSTDYENVHAHTYIPGNSGVLLMRQRGQVAHDLTTTTLVGYANTQIDIVQSILTTYMHTGKGEIRRDRYTDGLDAMAAGAVNIGPQVVEHAFIV